MQTLHVAVDESLYSLQGIVLGERLSRQLKARLVLTSVVPPDDMPEVRREALQMVLVEAGYGDYQEALQVEPSEDVADTLAALAVEREGALLCMNSHGRRPVSELLLGSVAAETVRLSGELVVLSGPRFDPHALQRIETLMVCVDGSALAEAVLPRAVALARGLGARLQLLQVVKPDAGAASARPAGNGHADITETGYLQGLAGRIRETHGIDADWEVLHGKAPAKAIVHYLAGRPNVMVAMTTHGRSGLSKLTAGSVSRAVLGRAHCPVALMRPIE
jgi:nucleotide-binding universal stress UspA family protein